MTIPANNITGPNVQPAAPTQTSATSYQEAALAALEAAEKGGETPAEAPVEAPPAGSQDPETPAGDSEPTEPTEQSKEDELKQLATKLEAEKKATAEKKDEEKPKEPALRNLQTLAEQSRKNREERAQLEAQQARLAEAELILRAKQSGDPIAVLTAAGFTVDQAMQKLWGAVVQKRVKPGDPRDTQEEVREDPKVKQLEEEVQQMRAFIQQRQREEAIQRLDGQFADTVKSQADKFKFVGELGLAQEARAELEAYYAKFGGLPADTLEESIEIALETIEHRERQRAEKYRKLIGAGGDLTAPGQAARQEGAKEAAPGPQGIQARAAKTLTNSTAAAAPRSGPTNPKTPEDFQAAALAALESAPRE